MLSGLLITAGLVTATIGGLTLPVEPKTRREKTLFALVVVISSAFILTSAWLSEAAKINSTSF